MITYLKSHDNLFNQPLWAWVLGIACLLIVAVCASVPPGEDHAGDALKMAFDTDK